MRKDLYVSLIRPHLEYAEQALNPYLQGDINKIDREQRRATRISFKIWGTCVKRKIKKIHFDHFEG